MRLAAVALLLLLVAGLVPSATEAQCAMCRTALEDSETGRAIAARFNEGILFLLGAPFAVVTGIGVLMHRSRRRCRFIE